MKSNTIIVLVSILCLVCACTTTTPKKAPPWPDPAIRYEPAPPTDASVLQGTAARNPMPAEMKSRVRHEVGYSEHRISGPHMNSLLPRQVLNAKEMYPRDTLKLLIDLIENGTAREAQRAVSIAHVLYRNRIPYDLPGDVDSQRDHFVKLYRRQLDEGAARTTF